MDTDPAKGDGQMRLSEKALRDEGTSGTGMGMFLNGYGPL